MGKKITVHFFIGGKNNVVMLISKSIIEEFEYNIICDSTLFYFSTSYFTNYSLWAKKLLYTFLVSIFAVYWIAISIVRILTGLCFVGTPPPLSGGFRLGYFHAYRVRPVSTRISKTFGFFTFVISHFKCFSFFPEIKVMHLLKRAARGTRGSSPI